MTHLMRAYARRRWAQTVFSREGALNVCVRARGGRVRDGMSGGTYKIRGRAWVPLSRATGRSKTRVYACTDVARAHAHSFI